MLGGVVDSAADEQMGITYGVVHGVRQMNNGVVRNVRLGC